MRSGCSGFEPLLSAWVDGELRANERARLGQHLSSCARCRAEIATLRATKALLSSMPVRQAPAALVDTTVGRTRRVSRHRTVRRAATRAVAGAGAAVMALAAVAFAVGGQPDAERVPVPVEVYVAQHLVRSVGGPVSTPVIVDQPSGAEPGQPTGVEPDPNAVEQP